VYHQKQPYAQFTFTKILGRKITENFQFLKTCANHQVLMKKLCDLKVENHFLLFLKKKVLLITINNVNKSVSKKCVIKFL
jgi:hypothetical protein